MNYQKFRGRMRKEFRFRVLHLIILVIAITILWFVINPEYLYDPDDSLETNYQDIKNAYSIVKLNNNENFDIIGLCKPCEIYFINNKNLYFRQLSIDSDIFAFANNLYSKLFYNVETNTVHFVNYPSENTYALASIKDDSTLAFSNDIIYKYDVQKELKIDYVSIHEIRFYPYAVDEMQELEINHKPYKDGIKIIFSSKFVSNGFTNSEMNKIHTYMNKHLGNFTKSDVYKMKQFSLRYKFFRRYYGKNYKPDAGYFLCNFLGMFDSNGDGNKDFLFALSSDRFLYNRIFCIDGLSNKLIWEKDFIPALNNNKAHIHDIDNDGIEEIFISFYSPCFEMPIDIYERVVFGSTDKARFIILDNKGELKEINGKPAIIESDQGFYDFHYVYIKEHNKVLLGLKSEYDNKQKKLITYDLNKNMVDTLGITYQHILDIKVDNDNILVFQQDDNELKKQVLTRNFELLKTYKKKVRRFFKYISNLNINLQDENFHLIASGYDKSIITDSNFKKMYDLDVNLMSKEQYVVDNHIYVVSRNKYETTITRLNLTLNRFINPYIIILFLTELMLLLFYSLIKQYIDIPMKSINSNYFVQYQILGKLHYWKLYGKLAVMNKQYKRISTNKDSPYKILKELSDDAGLVYYRNFFLLKYKVFEIKSADELPIIQDISHGMKNDFQKAEMIISSQINELEDKAKDWMGEAVLIINKLKTTNRKLFDFAQIHKLKKEKTGIKNILEYCIDEKINHPFFNKIEFVCTEQISESDIEISLDKAQFITAIENLLNNALEAIDSNGCIKINLNSQKGVVLIEIRNTLMDKKLDLNKVLERKYTTKGTYGLGVPITKTIIEKHGGTFDLSKTEKEFIVSISIPVNGVN